MSGAAPTVVVCVGGSCGQPGTDRADFGAGNGPRKGHGLAGLTAHVPGSGETARAGHLAWIEGQRRAAAGAAPCDREAGRARHDPERAHREFPERWRAYIRTNFRSLREIMQVFAVSERTARKWVEGETGCNGRHVAVAMQFHPQVARVLFAQDRAPGG